jgi:hypothetical protein
VGRKKAEGERWGEGGAYLKGNAVGWAELDSRSIRTCRRREILNFEIAERTSKTICRRLCTAPGSVICTLYMYCSSPSSPRKPSRKAGDTHWQPPYLRVLSLQCIRDEAAPSDAWPVRRLPKSLSLRRHVSLSSAAAGMSWRKLSSVRSTRTRQASRATA